MRAYPLDDPSRAISSERLSGQRIQSWSVPDDEQGRAALLDTIKREHGYVDEDFVELGPDTPNLEAICAKFDREHYHTEDEVRYVVAGEGIFDVRDETDRWIRIEVSAGDLIAIPAGTHHRFVLTAKKHIRCMRLFANHDGWSPVYRENVSTG